MGYHMNRYLNRFLLMIALGQLVACDGSETVSSAPVELFFGRYSAEQVGIADFPKEDSVRLAVDGSNYTLFTFPTADDPAVDFCTSTGTIGGFGTNQITFTVTGTVGANCDKATVPQGTIRAVYQGDSLIMRDTVDITFVRERDQGILDTVTVTWSLSIELTQ